MIYQLSHLVEWPYDGITDGAWSVNFRNAMEITCSEPVIMFQCMKEYALSKNEAGLGINFFGIFYSMQNLCVL